MDAKPGEGAVPSCSKLARRDLRSPVIRQCLIHLSKKGTHKESVSRRITDDSLITNCTFGKRTATTALGKNIHFQSVAVNYLGNKSGQ